MTSKDPTLAYTGFQFQQVPMSAGLTRSQIRWRLEMDWGRYSEQSSSAHMVCNVPASTKAAGKKPLVNSPLYTVASPAEPASSMAIGQHDTQSLTPWDTQSLEADLIPQQVSAHQVSANQAELGGSLQAAVSHQQAGTPSGTRRNNRQQSSGKRGRHRFCIDSESDEEPAQPKKARLDGRRKEIVAPFSLRSSRKGPDDAEQGPFFQQTLKEMGCCLN